MQQLMLLVVLSPIRIIILPNKSEQLHTLCRWTQQAVALTLGSGGPYVYVKVIRCIVP